MARLREGRAHTARGAAHFLRETVGRVRYGGARGQLTVRADSGFYTHSVVAACRKLDVRCSITIRQHQSQHNLIEAIPEEDWTPVPYWMDGTADVAEITYTPFQSEPDAAPVRLIVRRMKPTPGSQLALFATYSHHGFITDRDGETLELEADHRRHAEIENAIRGLKYGVGLNHPPIGPLRRQRRLAGGPGDGAQPGPLGSANRSGSADRDHQDPPAAVLRPSRTAHPFGTPVDPASSPALALGGAVQPRPGPAASHSTPSLTAPVRYWARQPANRRSPQTRASPLRDGLLLHAVPPISPSAAAVVRHWRPERQLPTATGPICWNRARTVALPCPSPFVPTPRPHRIGGFGLKPR